MAEVRRLLTRRRATIGLGSVAIAGEAMTANGEPGTAEALFRQEVVRLLNLQRPQWVLSQPNDVEELVIKEPSVPDLEEMRFYLGNLRRSVDRIPAANRDAEIIAFFDKLVAATTAPRRRNGSFNDIRQKLRARITPADFANLNYSPASRMVVGPFSQKTRVAYVVDSSTSLGFVMHDEIERWRVTVGDLHATAISNLDEASRQVTIEASAYPGVEGRYATFATDDSYDAARILAPGFRLRLRDALGGKVYIGIPNRDFMVCWSHDFGHRKAFAELVTKDEGKQPYPLTDELFVLTAGELRLATPDELSDHGR